MEGRISHQLQHPAQMYILNFRPAYHLLVATEKRNLDDGFHPSWWALRRQLSTHY